MKVGVLALQGNVREHLKALDAAGAAALEIRHAGDLDDVDAIVLPGGESTTIGKLLDRFGILAPLRDRLRDGMPAYGTCAGLILLADRLAGPHDAPHRLGGLDVTVRRNGYGRQADSFETPLDIASLVDPFTGVFIRAPVVEEEGPGVEVLARHDGAPVLMRQGRMLGSSFHPEMTGDDRVHRLFVRIAAGEV